MVQHTNLPGSVRRARPEPITRMNRANIAVRLQAAGRSASICLSSSHRPLTTRSQMGYRRRSPAAGSEPGSRVPPPKPDTPNRPNRVRSGLLRAGRPQAEAHRSGGSGYLLPWSFVHSRQAVGSPAPRSQRHLNPRVTGGLREQGRPAPRKTRMPAGGRGSDEHAAGGQPADHVIDVHQPGKGERLGLRAPERAHLAAGLPSDDGPAFPAPDPRCAARQAATRGSLRVQQTAGAGPVRPPSRRLYPCLSR